MGTVGFLVEWKKKDQQGKMPAPHGSAKLNFPPRSGLLEQPDATEHSNVGSLRYAQTNHSFVPADPKRSVIMADSDFEAHLTRGRAQWLTFVAQDASSKCVRIGLTHAPETGATERVLEFGEVRTITSNWFDRDDQVMETLIGAHENFECDSLRYMLHTDQREIWISAAAPATFTHVDSAH